jgi:Branched-chain amino acid transport protein (AzlD)
MTTWITIAALCAGTAAMKAIGPLAIRRAPPSRAATNVVGLLAPALLAALVVYETLHTGTHGLTLDARAVGVAAAAIALVARLPLTVVVVAAAVATALARALA